MRCKDGFEFVVYYACLLLLYFFALGQERCGDSIHCTKSDMEMVTVLLDKVGVGCCETKLKQAH